MERREFCFHCGEETVYEVKTEVVETEIGELNFSYEALVAYCSKCGEEMSIPEVNDLNIIRAYQKHKDLLEKA